MLGKLVHLCAAHPSCKEYLDQLDAKLLQQRLDGDGKEGSSRSEIPAQWLTKETHALTKRVVGVLEHTTDDVVHGAIHQLTDTNVEVGRVQGGDCCVVFALCCCCACVVVVV